MGHERRRSSTNGVKISSENCRATQQCVVFAAPRSFAAQVSHVDAQVSHVDGSFSTSMWLRDWGLACWRFLIVVRVRDRIFKPAAKKERLKKITHSITYIKVRRFYFV